MNCFHIKSLALGFVLNVISVNLAEVYHGITYWWLCGVTQSVWILSHFFN